MNIVDLYKMAYCAKQASGGAERRLVEFLSRNQGKLKGGFFPLIKRLERATKNIKKSDPRFYSILNNIMGDPEASKWFRIMDRLPRSEDAKSIGSFLNMYPTIKPQLSIPLGRDFEAVSRLGKSKKLNLSKNDYDVFRAILGKEKVPFSS